MKSIYKPFFESESSTIKELASELEKLVNLWKKEGEGYIAPYQDKLYDELNGEITSEVVDAIDGILMDDDFSMSRAISSLTRMLHVSERRNDIDISEESENAANIISRFVSNHPKLKN